MMARRVGFALATSLALLACQAAAPEHPAYAPGQLAHSGNGVVVSGAPLATDVGAAVLEQGGNAVDAAIATAFALAVVEPTMSGLGGRTQMLIRTPAGEFVGIDGTTEVPALAPGEPESDEDLYGYATIGIPGTVAALAEAHARYGSQPWAALVQPAIELAAEGFRLPPEEANRIAGQAERLREFEGSARHFLKPDGSAYVGGERFVQADLARTLRAVAEGGTAPFYRGWIADSIAADMARHGGFVRTEDLAQYRPRASIVVRGSYRGYDLVGTYLPASGATTIEALHILERFDLTGRAGSSAWAGLVAQALLLAFEDRRKELGTPEEQAELLTSKDWAASRAAEVRDPASGVPVAIGVDAWDAGATPEPAHTTHLSVADGEGGLVALTQSLGPTTGSRVATPGLGFLYAATMGYLGAMPPGSRPWSSQSPLVVLDDGRPVYVLGAAGGRRIISAIVGVVSRLADQNPSLAQAMAAPRLHPTNETVYMESRPEASWTASDLAEVEEFGLTAVARAEASYFARIHGIEIDAVRGTYIGVADPRWNGSARAARR
ncbi:MAG: gamma-glutamyltransferase [Gemmatimonadota bacterium]|nr:MAG: gamma-glutamyltransferase [Gemmatimonadota bacterium]